MSAVCTSQVDNATAQTTTYYFEQDISIPSYLLAIVIGNLQSQPIDSRTSVIAEPNVIGNYSKILRDLGNLLNQTEDYVRYNYVWGNYTILVLPPSFPVGGMENPLLTFASPTIMVPDGS
jgi:leukotriene-A4 hydrolase